MRKASERRPIEPIKDVVLPSSDFQIVRGEIEGILAKGIEEGIQNQSLVPLIEQISCILELLRNSQKRKGIAVFSCDSFCKPHYRIQQALIRSLRSTFDIPVEYIQAPAAHYLLSKPDHIVTEIFENLSLVKRVNKRLSHQQTPRPKDGSSEVDFFWFTDTNTTIGGSLDQLLKTVPAQEWDYITLENFPFHELAYRDLTNTYKLDFSLHSDDSTYRPTIRAATSLMLITFIGLILNDCCYETSIGAAFYSGNNIFRFFCKAIGATYIYMDGAQLDILLFGYNSRKIIRLLNTPIDIAYINTSQIAGAIFRAKLGKFARRRVKRLVALKTRGYGTHTYSKSIQKRDEESSRFIDLCSEVSDRGGKIVSMFSSSSDELVGQLLAYRHESIDLDHLSPPIFDSQQDWMTQTINHFGQVRPNDLLVVRIHPRLAEDHRGYLSSPGLSVLMNELDACSMNYDNIFIVPPSSNLSSYLIGSVSDLIINGWSTIGLDFAILGYRVIYGFPRTPYGGGAFHAVFDGIDAYSSVNHYYEVIYHSLNSCKPDDPLSAFMIQPELACKAYIVIHLAGCISLEKKEQLQSQLANPQILTDYLMGLITAENPLKPMLRSLVYSISRKFIWALGHIKNTLKSLTTKVEIP